MVENIVLHSDYRLPDAALDSLYSISAGCNRDIASILSGYIGCPSEELLDEHPHLERVVFTLSGHITKYPSPTKYEVDIRGDKVLIQVEMSADTFREYNDGG